MRPRLLLADDELSIRESLRKLLHAEQYDVVLAINGNEAVDKFRCNPAHFDMVLTGLEMPVQNAWASVDRLLEVDPLLPIILLTGIPNQQALAETAHVSALVEKPIDVPRLLKLMRELLIGPPPSQAAGLAGGQHSFQYLPSSQNPRRDRLNDPYWGLNES